MKPDIKAIDEYLGQGRGRAC